MNLSIFKNATNGKIFEEDSAKISIQNDTDTFISLGFQFLLHLRVFSSKSHSPFCFHKSIMRGFENALQQILEIPVNDLSQPNNW